MRAIFRRVAATVLSVGLITATTVAGDAPTATKALDTHLLVEDFEGGVVGGDPVDWVDTGAGNSMAVDDGLFSVVEVDGTQALSTGSTAANIHSHFVGAGAASASDYEFTGRMRMSAAGAGIGVTFLSDYNQSDSYYRLRRFGSGGSFRLSPHGTTISGGVTNTGVVPVVDAWYEFRIKVEDTGSRTEIRARVWESGTAEPSAWQIDAFDDGAGRLTAGTVGVWSYSEGSKFWDDLSVGDLAVPGPHVLTTAVVGAGSVAVEPDLVEYEDGSSVTVSASPDPGWVFAGWGGDLSGSVNPATVTMTADAAVTANFVEDVPLTLTTSTVGNGSVVVSPDAATYSTGESVTVSATPDPGWVFAGWGGDLSGSVNPATVTMTANTAITANFVEPPEGLLVEDFEGGVVGGDPVDWVDTGAGNSMAVDDGLFSVVEVDGTQALSTGSTAANIHSHFVGAGAASASDYEFTGRMRMSAAGAGIGVTFLSDYNQSDSYYRLRRFGSGGSFRLSPHGTTISGGVTNTGVVPVVDAWYEFRIKVEDTGSRTEIRARVWESGTAEPSAWQIDAFDDGAGRLTAGTVGVWSYSEGSKFWDDLSVGDLAVPGPHVLTTAVVGAGSVAVEPDLVEYEDGSSVTVSASPDPGWVFAGWGGDLSGSVNPATVTMTADAAVTANFVEDVPLTLTTSTVGNGSVVVSPDAATYSTGESVTVSATPDPGWVFAGWGGDLSGSVNPATVTMTANTAITANFVEDVPLTVSVGVTGSGSATIAPDQPTYSYGDVVTVTASPGPGWEFDSWTVAPSVANNWWDTQWAYRVPVAVSGSGFERLDLLAPVDVDFTAAWNEVGVTGVFDSNSVRVIEVDSTGGVIDSAVPFQFEPSSSFDPSADATGVLKILVGGSTGADETRYFDVYFDDVSAGIAAPNFTGRVEVVDNVDDEGRTTVRIDNDTSTMFYDKDGGGFTSVLDSAGNDWVSWNNSPGSAGQFRGIPNLVYPEGFMHPGANGITTTIEQSGPVSATLRSISDDGLWDVVWEIGPRSAELTVLSSGHDYWFLYEGTPGGSLDEATDIVVRSDGTQTNAGQAWTGDIVGDEWVYFGDPGEGRSLYVVNQQPDSSVDSYRSMDGNMTVFGFGRDDLSTLLSSTPRSFTVGLVDDTAIGPVSEELDGQSRPTGVTVAAAESRDLGVGLTDEVLVFPVTSDHTVTANFVEIPPPTLSVTSTGDGSVIVDPDLAEYAVGQVVTLTASPAVGSVFDAWGGDLSGSTNPTTIVMDGDKSVVAWFEQENTGQPVIDIWYGNDQNFGEVGLPQRWINVLGNVSDPDGIASLSYRLNGGPPRTLNIGPDNRRLAMPGDFNVDIDALDLVDGANAVAISAVDGVGEQVTKTVTVNYSSGNAWPLTYTADWGAATRISDVAQVVDGKWGLEDDGVRILEPDYDRLISLGDMNWTDYEVTLPAKINAIDSGGFGTFESGDGAGLGMLYRWKGHTDTPVFGWQPKTGWEPYGAIGWFWWSRSPDISDLRIENAQSVPFTPVVGETYFLKMRVETVPGVGSTYRLKAWDVNDAEPSGWNVQATDSASSPGEGSLLLIAHHIDVTFGDVTVNPLGAPTGTLVTNTVGSGTITRDPDKSTYAFGEEVTLTAVPDPGWVFTGWSGAVSSTQNPIVVDVTGSQQITANFASTTVPPVVSDVSVVAAVDAAVVSWTTDKPASSSVAFGESSGYELGSVSDAALSTSHSVTLTGLALDTTYHFEVTSVDEYGNSASSPDGVFTTLSSVNPSGIVSDDFNACGVDGAVWSFVDPVGDGSAVVNGTQLELVVPGGVAHDVWAGGNMAPRLMQPTNDVDFEIETKFESMIGATYQLQGVIVEEDVDDFLRFDFYSAGGQVNVLAARFVAGSPAVAANVAVPVTAEPMFLKVTRVGDTWTVSYSTDGSTWTPVTSFDHALAVTQTGVFAGNAGGGAPAHTALVDYFFNTTMPIIPEDATTPGSSLTLDVLGPGSVTMDPDKSSYFCSEDVTLTAVPDSGALFDGWSGTVSSTDNPLTVTMSSDQILTAGFSVDTSTTVPPVVSDVSVVAAVDAAVVSWTTDKPASSSVAFGESSGYELGSVSDAALSTSHSVTLTGLALDTTYHFEVTSVDEYGNSASSPDGVFTTLSSVNPSGIVSDDFNACGVDGAVWSFVDPVGDGSAVVNGTQLELVVPGGVAHDVWAGGNMAPRLMQPTNDVDFEIETKFESMIGATYQLQGVIVEEDVDDFLRFDFYSAGGQVNVFAARFVAGSPAVAANVAVPVTAEPMFLKVTRVGDTWTVSYSTDGSTWTPVTSFDHALAVTQTGVFAGNAGGGAPAHTALVDYFFNTTMPIIPEDATTRSCS